MKKLILAAALGAAVAVPPLAFAQDLYLSVDNGPQQAMDDFAITHSAAGVVYISVTSSSNPDPDPDPDPVPDPDPDPVPDPDPDPNNGEFCTDLSEARATFGDGVAVNILDAIDLAVQQSVGAVGPGPAGIVSEPLQNSFSSTYSSEYKLASWSNSAQAQKRIWVSKCPGGEPLDQGPRCDGEWNEAVTIKFDNSSLTKRGYYPCRLEEGETYYVNVKGITCSGANGGCTADRSVYLRND